ncbi:Glycosyl transferase family 2 [Bradyrhizobium shewense]|uniref:Glycosyl transferase family 2 n=1 Tax=Bradyrhizobium shewense TaxID=1761772 RepID=A0A1C3TYT4_9BRAD|nr:glycosyltransferase [Bradyrhizobium shewense]SCB08413.1 Glycosyl transferase family 2 [Bradyrhizobium shewense]
MISIIVPAHNESSVIARLLGQWVSNAASDQIGVVVVCNGCTDDTANVARRFGSPVQVVETDTARKTHALNIGDQISGVFPRMYADADIVLTLDAIQALARRLEKGDVLAVAPTADIDLTDCSWLVRKYYAIWSRLPSSCEGIGGSGVYFLSEAGRRRFGQFPDVVADDIYVRLQFKAEERETLPHVKSKVFPARSISKLIAVRSRAYAGVFEITRRFPELSVNRSETNNRTLIRLFRELRLWPGLLIYCYVNIRARFRAVRSSNVQAAVWQRDDTSRRTLSAGSPS